MLRYLTAGESHGKAILALVDGFPAGVELQPELIDAELHRRQGGYGRGGRQRLEADQAEVLSGVWRGVTLGSPIALLIPTKDYKIDRMEDLPAPRPGHGDLSGSIKYFSSIRAILERASARDTVARVAAGALAKQLLAPLGIAALGYVAAVGAIAIEPKPGTLPEHRALRDRSLVYTLNPDQDDELKAMIDQSQRSGDTLGGIVEVRVEGVPFGLGSHAQWDQKLDGRLARAVMSVQAIKGVEIGMGFEAARLPGSKVHDPIGYDPAKRLADARFHAIEQPRRRAGGRHEQLPADRGSRGDEADQHVGASASLDQPEDEGPAAGRLRAEQRLRRGRGKLHCRERGRFRDRRRRGRAVWRQLPGGNPGPLEFVSREWRGNDWKANAPPT